MLKYWCENANTQVFFLTVFPIPAVLFNQFAIFSDSLIANKLWGTPCRSYLSILKTISQEEVVARGIQIKKLV